MSPESMNKSLLLFRRILTVAGILAIILALGSAEKMAMAEPGPAGLENVLQPDHQRRSDLTGNTNSAITLPPSNAALNFDGSNDIVDSGDTSVLNGVSQYTIETWVKFDSFSNFDTVLAKRVSDGDRAAMLQAWGSDGDIAVAVDTGYGHTSAPLSPGMWYHIAVVYDGAQATDAERLKLYVDGLLQPLTFPFGSVPTTTSSTASRFTLGAEYNGTTPINAGSLIAVPFEGTLDEVRIWDFARTQLQIQADKDIELTGSESGLEVYYNFNQGIPDGDNSGLTTLNDRAGTAQDGTLWNFALTGASSNWVGQAFFTYRNYLPVLVTNE